MFVPREREFSSYLKHTWILAKGSESVISQQTANEMDLQNLENLRAWVTQEETLCSEWWGEGSDGRWQVRVSVVDGGCAGPGGAEGAGQLSSIWSPRVSKTSVGLTEGVALALPICNGRRVTNAEEIASQPLSEPPGGSGSWETVPYIEKDAL